MTPEILTKLAEVSDWEAIVEEEQGAEVAQVECQRLRTKVSITIDRVAAKALI